MWGQFLCFFLFPLDLMLSMACSIKDNFSLSFLHIIASLTHTLMFSVPTLFFFSGLLCLLHAGRGAIDEKSSTFMPNHLRDGCVAYQHNKIGILSIQYYTNAVVQHITTYMTENSMVFLLFYVGLFIFFIDEDWDGMVEEKRIIHSCKGTQIVFSWAALQMTLINHSHGWGARGRPKRLVVAWPIILLTYFTSQDIPAF